MAKDNRMKMDNMSGRRKRLRVEEIKKMTRRPCQKTHFRMSLYIKTEIN